MKDSDQLLHFREEFPILQRSTYLVSNSLGAMPRAVPRLLARYSTEWAERGVRAWAEGWWEMPAKVGDVIAPLIGAESAEVVMVPTVTHAMSQVLSAVPITAERNEIVMTALDFPSVRYAYDALAPQRGAVVKVVPSDDGIGIDTQRVIDSITERTALVAISHVLFRSAYIMDAAAICEAARSVGARVVLDAYHSVGVIPVDVHALGVDFLCGGVLKWLCGGPGGCFLYSSSTARRELQPALTGWQAHNSPFAFSDSMDFASSAWRWLGGTPVVPALYAAMAGPQILADAGIAEVRAKSVRQTAKLVAAADSRGWAVHAPKEPARRGGTVAFNVPEAASVARALLAENIIVDYRPNAGIRVAPHFYTTDSEIDSCIDAIDEVLRSGRWKQWEGITSTVT